MFRIEFFRGILDGYIAMGGRNPSVKLTTRPIKGLKIVKHDCIESEMFLNNLMIHKISYLHSM